MVNRSYSQNSEDLLIADYFKHTKINILDVGANNGIMFSNSRYFIENGMCNEAYLFEPSSECASLFSLYAGVDNVHVYCKGIAATAENRVLYESGAHVAGGNDRALVSTCIPEEMERWNRVEFKKRIAEFVDFNGWHVDAGHPVLDFISIDVEGMEMEILQQINLTKVGCRCLCIEWNSKPELASLYTSYCLQHGLTELHRNAENILFYK